MIRPISLIASVVPLLCLGAAALADGQPREYAPGRGCAPGAFGGAYIGAAAGFVSHDADGNPVGAGPLGDRDTGFTFGGYAGYNWQCDNLVLGVETDFNWADTSASASDTTGGTISSSLDWYGTVRARLGYVVHNDLLIYGTGGFAYANVDHTLTQVPPPFAFSQSDNDLLTGWTLGGGIERQHDERWLFRAEAFFVDLGGQGRTYVGSPVACAGPCTLRVNWDDEFWVGRLGLTYKFGHREEVVPLK